MRTRVFAVGLVLVLALAVVAVLVFLPVPKSQTDLAKINDVTATLGDDFDQLHSDEYMLPHYAGLKYAVIDNDGQLLKATERGISESVNDAIKHGDLILDVSHGGQVLGKVIFYDNTQELWQAYRDKLALMTVALLVLMAASCGVFYLVVHRQVLRPFNKMRGFAQRVAAGDLETPLKMDRDNAFGAFTESFDLMREELRRARENERAAEQSKRELVAELSHDIQTPVASIKAVAELMEVTADDEQRLRLQTIQQKTEQIHSLVTDLFHATLEELDSLSVEAVGVGSDALVPMVQRADFRGKAVVGDVPGCLLRADPVRLAQVMDNIVANSYKYADTAIEVSAQMHDEGLAVVFRDFGPGAEADELPLLFSKYYRGKAAQGINGYGLGLFISRYLMERMGGRMECANAQPGFAVTLFLRYDG